MKKKYILIVFLAVCIGIIIGLLQMVSADYNISKYEYSGLIGNESSGDYNIKISNPSVTGITDSGDYEIRIGFFSSLEEPTAISQIISNSGAISPSVINKIILDFPSVWYLNSYSTGYLLILDQYGNSIEPRQFIINYSTNNIYLTNYTRELRNVTISGFGVETTKELEVYKITSWVRKTTKPAIGYAIEFNLTDSQGNKYYNQSIFEVKEFNIKTSWWQNVKNELFVIFPFLKNNMWKDITGSAISMGIISTNLEGNILRCVVFFILLFLIIFLLCRRKKKEDKSIVKTNVFYG